MKTIRYKFADGTVSEARVSDELFAIHEEMVEAEKSNHRKNTRRHDLLSALNENEIDIPNDDDDAPTTLIEQEHGEFLIRHWKKLNKALEVLSSEQRKIVQGVFYEKRPLIAVAEEMGITYQAIQNRLKRILEKLKKFLI